MDYQIPDYKPTLKQRSSSKVDSTLEQPSLAFDNSNSKLIMFTNEKWSSIVTGWMKTLMMFLAFTAILVTLIYSILAASLMFFTVVDGKSMTVARGTFLGGVPSPGTTVLASSDQEAPKNFVEKLGVGWAGVSGAQILEIKSGPNDFITSNSQSVTVKGEVNESFDQPVLDSAGEPVNVTNQQLLNSYIAECVGGNCTEGTLLIVGNNLIHGEVKK